MKKLGFKAELVAYGHLFRIVDSNIGANIGAVLNLSVLLCWRRCHSCRNKAAVLASAPKVKVGFGVNVIVGAQKPVVHLW